MTAPTGHDWTLEIVPHRGLLDLRLGELAGCADLVRALVHRDLVVTYKQTVLGPLWIVLQPLLTTAVFATVFGALAGLSSDGLPHAFFYLAGIVCWTFAAELFGRASATLVDNEALFGKVRFPRLVVPLATLVAALVRFAVHALPLAAVVGWYAAAGALAPRAEAILVVPAVLLALSTTALGLGLLCAAATARYRDLRHLLQFGVQLAMYVTPVIYPLSALPEALRSRLAWNPLAPPIEAFRAVLGGGGSVPLGALAASLAFGAAALAAGVVAFNRAEARFADSA